MQNDQLKVIFQKIDSLQKSIDNMDRDLGKDREEMQQFTIRLGAVESQIDELRKAIRTMSDKTADKVEEVVAPMIEETHKLKSSIDKKRAIYLKPKSWLDRFKRR